MKKSHLLYYFYLYRYGIVFFKFFHRSRVFFLKKHLQKEGGQSILEFLILAPFVFSIIMLMVRVNTVVQAAIVNQQYARAQTLYLTYHSPTYPRLQFRYSDDELSMLGEKSHLMMLGVTDELIPDRAVHAEPVAPEFRILGPGKKKIGSNKSKSEPNRRGNVRVRVNVALCTQMNFLDVNGDALPITPSNLIGDASFDFCLVPYDTY